MNYSNTNCFGTPLAEDTKCKINHKLVGKFPYFNFSSKCYLEDTKPFKGANRVVLRCSGDALMKAFTPGYMPWFQGIFDFKEFGNCLWSAYEQTSGNKRLVLEVEKQTISNYTILPTLIAEGGTDTWHQLEIYYPGDIKKSYFKFDGELVTFGISTSANTDAWEDIIRIGYCPASNSSSFLRTQFFKGGMCDFRVYKDDELLYHLPLQTYDPDNGYSLYNPEDFDVGPYLSKPVIKRYDTSIDLQTAYSNSENLGYSYNLIHGYKRVTSSPTSYYGGKYPIKSNPSIGSAVETLVYPGLPAGHNGDPDVSIDLSDSGLPPNTLTKFDAKEALKFTPNEYYYCERVMTPDYNIVGKQNIKLYRTPQTGQNKEFLEYCMARNVFIPYEERNQAWELTQRVYKENNIEYQLHPYIQSGMALWLDGCNNSKYGHYTNVRTWQDLAPLEKNSFHINNSPPFKGTFCWTNTGFRKFLDYNYNQVILPNETLYNSTGNLPSKIDACTIEMSFTPLQTFTSAALGRDLFHLGKIITNGVSSYNLILKAIINEGNTLRLLVGTGNNTYQTLVLKKQLGDMSFKTYHIAITIGAGTSGKITAYLNGTQIYTGNKPSNYSWITTTNGNPNYFEFLHKPENNNNNYEYFGDVHSVRYYDRELTAIEVGWNFAEDRRRYF